MDTSDFTQLLSSVHLQEGSCLLIVMKRVILSSEKCVQRWSVQIKLALT